MATLPSPPARTNAQIAYDAVTQKVVLFGGFNGRNYLGDTWLWDGTASRWTQVRPTHSPTAVTGPMLFTDPNGSVDLFGGFDGRFYQGTMWQWNGFDWNQLFPATLPYARSSAAVGVNNSTGEVVMFGGLADVNPFNTWTYDGTTWTLQSPAYSTHIGVRRLRRFRSAPECSCSLRWWKRRRRPEQYVGMAPFQLETTACNAVAFGARRCRHCLRPCLRPCDYLRRTKQ